MKFQLESGIKSPNAKWNWKFNYKMEINVDFEIGKKLYKYNENWQMGDMKKKVVCKTARRAHSQKKIEKDSVDFWHRKMTLKVRILLFSTFNSKTTERTKIFLWSFS